MAFWNRKAVCATVEELPEETGPGSLASSASTYWSQSMLDGNRGGTDFPNMVDIEDGCVFQQKERSNWKKAVSVN
jgi:hypothetical protein